MERFADRLIPFAERPALVHDGSTWSYRQLAERIAVRRAEVAERGVTPGSVVAIVSDYSFEAIALFFALQENRNVVVPITTDVETEVQTRLEEGQVDWVLRLVGDRLGCDSGPGLGRPKHGLLEEMRATGSAGLILFSSGSTGRPKAMVHDLDRLVERHAGKRAKNLVILVFLMFDHIGGLNTLLGALSTGSELVIPGSRDPEEVCALIARHGVNVLPSSPTFLNLMLMGGAPGRHDLSSLRMITYGTEPMPEALLGRLRSGFPRVRFHQTFGTSETGIAQTSSRSSDSNFLKIEDPDLEYRIVDGELWLRSKTQIRGYLNASMEAFTEDGWFRTGDLVETAADGFLRIVGRAKEVINVGGEKVLPAEVEAALMTMPNVKDCSVHGVVNPITGQTVVAEVVLDTPMDPRELRLALRRHLKDRLATYKIPTKVDIVERTHGSRFKKMRGPASRV